jgi:predicted transposase YbfD/YdcC
MCTQYIINSEKIVGVPSPLQKEILSREIFFFKPDPVTFLFEMLCCISDPRRGQGKIHQLPLILLLAVLAICCGYDSYGKMADFCKDYQEKISEELSFISGHIPHKSTFQRVFTRLKASQLEEVFCSYIAGITSLSQGEGIALDGKTVHKTGIHLVSAFAHKAKAVLFQMGTDEKGKELVVGPQVIAHIDITGKIVTADALFAQRNFCEFIAEKKGGYTIRVKENQETLEKEIRMFFQDPPFRVPLVTYHDTRKVSGQTEEREVQVSDDPQILAYLHWPGLTHIWQQRKTITKGKEETTVISVGISRITNEMRGETPIGQKVAETIREHWGIENGAHRRRDVDFNEDHGRIRTGSGPQVMAAMRNLVITLFNKGKVRSFPRAMRRFRAHPEELFTFLGINPISVA